MTCKLAAMTPETHGLGVVEAGLVAVDVPGAVRAL